MPFSKSTFLHLRIPFSVFLMPVFCFAAAVSAEAVSWPEYVGVWVILHLFLYPASNGYNSYYDKDEESIGGLEHPPEVSHDLLTASLLFDAVALGLGFWFGWRFALMLLVYGLVSKAYSHPAIRLKKYPVIGLLTVGFFQGAFTFGICTLAFREINFAALAQTDILFPALLSTVLLLGSYPMTQVYQHAEDSRRGDRTLSLMLGVRGTFAFTAVVFLLANAGFLLLFWDRIELFILFQFFLLPVLGYFGWWAWQVWQDEKKADFRRTMRLNQLSSLSMICFFSFWFYLSM